MSDGDITAWADEYGLTYPVLSDPSQAIAGDYIIAEGGSYGLPNYSVLDRNMVMQAKYVDHSTALALADQLLGEDFPDVDWPMPDEVASDDDDDDDADDDDAGDDDSAAGDGSGNPFGAGSGGSACSVSPASSATPLLATLLLPLGLLIRRRSRH